jgi:hypothetical protein
VQLQLQLRLPHLVHAFLRSRSAADHRANRSTHSHHGNRSTGGGAAHGAAQGAGSVAAGADSQLGGVAVCVGIDGVRVGCSPAMGRDGRMLATAGSASTGMAVSGLWPATACGRGKQGGEEQAGQDCSAAAPAVYRIEVWAEGEGQWGASASGAGWAGCDDGPLLGAATSVDVGMVQQHG